MSNSPSPAIGSPAPHADAELVAFQRRLSAEYLTEFEAWVPLAANQPGQSGTRSLSLLGKSADLNDVISQATVSRKVTIDLVYDLAVHCRNFIAGDAWGWAFFLRRQSFGVQEVLASLPARINETTRATHEFKWLVALRQFSPNVLQGYNGGQEWIENAWSVAVKEAIENFVADRLKPAIEKSIRQEHVPVLEVGKNKSNTARIEKFMLDVEHTTGTRIQKQDFTIAAGYADRREFQKFQAGKGTKTATQRFKALLKTTPREFLDRLEKKTQAATRNRKRRLT